MHRQRNFLAPTQIRIVLIATLLGIGAFFVDAFVYALISIRGTSDDYLSQLTMELLRPNGNEIWARSTVLVLFVTFGFYLAFERWRSDAAIARLAYYDALTGLANRTLLLDRLRYQLSHAKRREESMAVLFIDLDNFKLVNDTLGHEAGDMLLAGIALRLTKCIRQEDTVARVGGDEFVVVARCFSDPGDAAVIARKIIDALSAPFSVYGQELFVTTSIGIALFPQDGDDAGALLKNADTAMYHAKSEGKNRYQFFTEEMNKRVQERLRMETHLHLALERREFLLFYQPQFDCTTLRVTGAEAFIRWQRPGQGLLAPEDFIPAARDAGMMGAIGAWVLETAYSEAQKWPVPGLMITVNLSLPEIMQDNFMECLRRALGVSGLATTQLELELNDAVLLDKPEIAWPRLKFLREMGVRIAVDGFGLRQSSFAQLARLPVDTVKIDRAFVRGVVHGRREQAIVDSLLVLARGLDLATVGEGIEHQDQLKYLQSQHCDRLQGAYLAPPMPGPALREFIARMTGARV